MQRWQLTPWHLKTDERGHHHRLSEKYSGREGLTLRGGKQVISLSGLKAALLFIDAQQKRVGSETAWIKKGDDAAVKRAARTALKKGGDR